VQAAAKRESNEHTRTRYPLYSPSTSSSSLLSTCCFVRRPTAAGDRRGEVDGRRRRVTVESSPTVAAIQTCRREGKALGGNKTQQKWPPS